MKLQLSLFLLCIVPGFWACNEADTPPSSYDTDQLFFNYSITAEEGKEWVTCKFEYRYGRAKGKAVSPGAGSKVMLDGELLQPDSTKFAGVYFEANRQAAGFEGSHEVVFIAPDGKKLAEQFSFRPLRLSAEPGATVSRKAFQIALQDFPEGGKLQLIMIDTSFESPDVNEELQVRGGQVTVTEQLLKKVVNGPIILELHQETSRPLGQKTRAGGRFTLYSSLKREFDLTD